MLVQLEAPGDSLDVTRRDFLGGQKIFDRYTLKRILGRGGMGVVWLANDDELEREVALKFLPELLVLDRGVLTDLKRETRRSLELTHKNIVRIYDFTNDKSTGCISMEYIDGDTLSNLRADKPQKVFEPEELKEWIAQLCDALDYAHNLARIVHRDLKPANLMVNKGGQLKVADFGIARSMSDSMSMLTMDHGKSGTLLYMSPQQLVGERSTHLDDVYSLGSTIYELLTSKPPFYSGNIELQTRTKIPIPMSERREELEIDAPPINQTWEQVVAQCLAKKPADRPQSVAEVAERLDLPSTTTRRTTQVVAKPPPPNLAAGIVGIAVIVCAIAMGTWYFVSHRAAEKQNNRAATSAPVTQASVPPVTQAAVPPVTQAAVPPVTQANVPPAPSATPESSQPPSIQRPQAVPVNDFGGS
ncbi:MAG TPA: protein kinase [Chthoniobacterales bacterium]|jgi:serine/threonine protein kinase|nr:protein kinase [Chthoniobacterales bacterium]